MEFYISKKAEINLEKEAVRFYPFESCGILLGTKSNGKNFISEIAPLKNQETVENQKYNFEINPLEFYSLEKRLESKNLKIIGFYHSHAETNARPSRKDEKYMIPNILYVISSITKRENCEYAELADLKAFMKSESNEHATEIFLKNKLFSTHNIFLRFQ